jgi:hypothetical protein
MIPDRDLKFNTVSHPRGVGFQQSLASTKRGTFDTSHVPMLSKPELVIDVIRKAVAAVQKS